MYTYFVWPLLTVLVGVGFAILVATLASVLNEKRHDAQRVPATVHRLPFGNTRAAKRAA